jgi:glycosyltransferase involved in cell wall biosynthesis
MLKPQPPPSPANSTPEVWSGSMLEAARIGGVTREQSDGIPGAINPPTVTLSLGSQPFQMAVAERLQRDGALRRVLAFSAGVEIFDPDGAEGLKLVRRYRRYRLVNRLMWAAWRRLPGSGRTWNMPIVASTAYADWLASRWVPPAAIFHGWTGDCLACIKRARQLGSIIMIEQATMHPSDWQDAVLRECETFGIRPGDCLATLPARLIRRMEREFEMADAILVPSQVARRSFERAGYAERTIVVNAGVDHHFFAPPSKAAPRDIFRVCYAGRVELLKGIPYLLRAWNRLGLTQAELVLIGEVAPEMQRIIKQWALPNVRFLGFLPASELADWYRASHLFVFPSVNEGLARVIFEAMSCGLPVVATERSGAGDCITPGIEGSIVPARDVTALAEAILWHYRNPEASAAMGSAARSGIERQFTLPHYVERVIGIYRAAAGKLAGAVTAHPRCSDAAWSESTSDLA